MSKLFLRPEELAAMEKPPAERKIPSAADLASRRIMVRHSLILGETPSFLHVSNSQAAETSVYDREGVDAIQFP
jgi:hypothetical protein